MESTFSSRYRVTYMCLVRKYSQRSLNIRLTHQRNTGYKTSPAWQNKHQEWRAGSPTADHSGNNYWEPIKCQTTVNTYVTNAFVELRSVRGRKDSKELTEKTGDYSEAHTAGICQQGEGIRTIEGRLPRGSYI